MKNLNNLFLAVLTVGAMAFTGCLHIVEDVTFRDKGNGTYKMTLDMSEVKTMMDAMKGMAPDSAAAALDSTVITEGMPEPMPGEQDNSMAQMGEQMANVTSTLKGVQGITNVVEKNDTATYTFGYSFDFADVVALNRALKIINKDKFDSKTDEVFKFNGKTFERLGTGDIGGEMKKALAENEGETEGDESSMDMMKMMFADMTYQQVYHFPDRQVKKAENALAELSDDNHTISITIKPFDEEQAKKKVSVATTAKLK